MRSVRWAIVALWCASAAGQQGPVYRVGGGVKAPIVLEKQEPDYSEEARLAKLQGSILLSVTVGEDGVTRDLRVRRSLGLGLDEKALEAVSHWRFTPATKDAQPVPVAIDIEVNFRMMASAREWHLARATFTAPEGATLPAVMKAPYPTPSGTAEQGSVALAFDVDEQGMPANIHVENSSDPQWEREVIALFREWRFQAAMRNGGAVVSRGSMEFRREAVGTGAK